MSKIPGEHFLIAVTFDPSCPEEIKSKDYSKAYTKLAELAEEATSIHCYRFLTDEDDPMDYLPEGYVAAGHDPETFQSFGFRC